jgi:HEAT repeat protein
LIHRVTPCLFASILALAAPAAAQRATAPSREAQLARGWSALAEGRAANAAEIAGRLLAASPRDHAAISLAVAARLVGPQPLQALDVYEKWLGASRREDPFLLEDIGAGVLRALGDSEEPRVKYAAMAALAAYGDRPARDRLAALATEEGLSVEGEAALARAGDPAGVQRLTQRIRAGGPQDKSYAIEALKDSGQPGIAAVIADALRDPAPPSRIAAANALAELGATSAIPQLKAALVDPEPAVRTMVETALGLLGDPEHRGAVDRLATSPLADFRLMHARYSAEREPAGPWQAAAQALVADPDPLVRLGAIELLLKKGAPEAASMALSTALDDPSGPFRTLAASLLPDTPLTDRSYPLIRKALRDPLADVRVQAARALLPRP